jgi:hypothetical protein
MARRSALVVPAAVVAGALLVSGCSDSTSGPAPESQLVIYGSSHPAPAAAVAVGPRLAYRLTDPAMMVTDSAAPSHLAIVMYALYVSPNADCSAAVLAQDYGAAGQVKDFAAGPVLFAAEPSAGAYACIAFRMSDVLLMQPERSFGACDASVTYDGDIYRDGESDWIDVDGASVIGHGGDGPGQGVDDHVTIFFSSDTAAALARGISRHQLVPMAAPLVSPGQSTMYWDMSGAVQEEGGQCGILPRPITFR